MHNIDATNLGVLTMSKPYVRITDEVSVHGMYQMALRDHNVSPYTEFASDMALSPAHDHTWLIYSKKKCLHARHLPTGVETNLKACFDNKNDVQMAIVATNVLHVWIGRVKAVYTFRAGDLRHVSVGPDLTMSHDNMRAVPAASKLAAGIKIT